MVIIAIVILLTVLLWDFRDEQSSKNISKEKWGLTTADKNAAVGIVKSYWEFVWFCCNHNWLYIYYDFADYW